MKEALMVVTSLLHYAGIELISDRILDEATTQNFRNLLEKHNLGEQIFEMVNTHLIARGITMCEGSIVDTSLIAVPRFTQDLGEA